MDISTPHIYKRTIIETGKSYIGKHNGKDKYYKGSGIDWKKDLEKFKNYQTEILEYVEDISKLNEREIYWLEYYDAANNPLFYNKTNKSYGAKSHTEEWKKNQSLRMIGKSTTKGKKWKVKDTSNMKGGGTLGKKWKCLNPRSEETKYKISKSLKGRNIDEWKDKIYSKSRNEAIKISKGKGIIQLTLDNDVIKEWISYNDVRKGGYPGVQNAIKTKKPYKNFLWLTKINFIKDNPGFENNRNIK